VNRGGQARRPQDIPRKGWRDIVMRVKTQLGADHVSIVAAGVAFFGLLAIFPAMVALVSIAGLVLDPATIDAQLASVLAVLPENGAAIIEDQARDVASRSGTGIGLAAFGGIAIALFSAAKGMKSLMEGMNIAYGEEESRGIVVFNLVAIALTLFLILGVVIALVIGLAMPVLAGLLPLSPAAETAILYARWPVLGVLAVVGLSVIYRYGPSRENPQWRWVSPGAIAATLVWLAGSIGFSLYVGRFDTYNETYGALGGVVILLTWLWLSSYIVLLGAEINAEMEHQTDADTTTGARRPKGKRGARMADTSTQG
jgi:membrane protein